MEADLFMYGTGMFSDAESASEYSEATTAAASAVSGTKTPRKFGTDLSQTSLGNRNYSKQQKSSTKKITSTAKKQSAFKKLDNSKIFSPQSESDATPKVIRSRFSNKRNLFNGGDKVQGSFESVENRNVGSTPDAKFQQNHVHTNEESSADGSDVAPPTRFARTKVSPGGSTVKGVEYTVKFEPGPIGLKLEPVIKNGSKEYGCRVMKLVANSKDSSSLPSQAVKSGMINIGDILTAVNGKNVTSKPYKDIVSLLTTNGSNSETRSITFRVPRSPAPVMPTTPATAIRRSSEPVFNSTDEEKKENLSKIETSVSTPNQNETQSDKNESSVLPIFSPSYVKKMSKSNGKDSSKLHSTPNNKSKPLSDVLNTVMKNVAPALIATDEPAHMPGRLSTKIARVFTGISSKETNDMVHMKMELLNELSQAKASLGEQEKNIKMMTKIMDEIHKEKVAVLAKNEMIEDELIQAQEAMKLSESMLHEKDEYLKTTMEEKDNELKRAQCNLEETTARVHDLAKQNGLLRAQYEQLKVQFNGKERDFTRQLAKATKESEQAEQLRQKISMLEKKLVEKDRKLDHVSKELNDRTAFAEKKSKEVTERDNVISKMEANLKEVKVQSEGMEATYKANLVQIKVKVTEMEQELVQKSAISEELKQENSQLNDDLREALSRIDSISEKLQEERDENEHNIKVLVRNHEEQVEKLRNECEITQKQLQDSKQIIESTTAELCSKLSSANKEIDQRKESERQLLKQMRERESDLRRENEKLHHNLTEAVSKNSILESNFKQIQDCLFDTTEKSKRMEHEIQELKDINKQLVVENESLSNKLTHIEAVGFDTNEKSKQMEHEIQELKDINTQLVSENEYLSNKLTHIEAVGFEATERSKRMEHEIQELKDINTQLVSENESLSNKLTQNEVERQELVTTRLKLQNDINAITTESQSLRLELSEVKRSSEAKVLHLTQKLEQQASTFDHEKIRFEEQITDSKIFIEKLMKQIEVGSSDSAEAYKQRLEKIQDRLSESEQVVQKLKHDKEQIVLALKSCEEERDALLKEKQSLQGDIEIALNETKRWMESSQTASAELAQVKNDLEEQKNLTNSKVKEIQLTVDRQCEEQDTLLQNISRSEKEHQHQRKTLEQEIERLKDELERAQENFTEQLTNGSMIKQILDLEDKLRSSRQEIIIEKEALRGELEKQRDLHDKKLADMHSSFAATTKEKEDFIEKLQIEIEEKQRSLEEMVKEKTSLDSNIEKALSDLCEREKLIQDHEQEIQLLRAELCKCQKDLEIANDRKVMEVGKLQEILHQYEREIEHQKTKSDQLLDDSMQNAQKRIDQLQKNYKESAMEKDCFIEKLQGEIEEKQDSIEALRIESQNAIRDKEKLENILYDTKNQLALAQKDLENTNIDLAKEREIVLSLKVDCQNQVVVVKKLQDSLAEKDTIISDLRNEVNEKQETIDNQALEYQDADNARYEYELQVQNLQLSYNSACMELSRLKKLAEEHQETMRSKLLDVDAQRQEEFEGLKAHYDSILERKELALSSIKEEVANLREENQSLIELESHSTSMLKETTAELEKLKEASSLADKEHQAIVHALRTVQHELEEQQIRANADSAEYRAKSERAQEMLTQVIASLQQDIKDTIANLQQDIKETVSSLHKDISDKKASIESLLCQISDLEAKLVCVTQDAKRSKEGLTEEANKTKEAHEIIESLRRLTAEKDAEITSISANFDALYADYCGMREESQRTNESLKNQLCSAQSKYADEIEEIRVSQAKEREELSRNLDEAQETITNCRNQLNSMQQLLEQRKESIETLQNKEFEMDSLLKEKQGEISKLHNVVESLQTSLNEQSIKNQNYKEEIDTIKQALHKSEKNLELQTRNLEEEASERDNEMRILYNDLTKTCVELKLNIEATSSSSSKLERSRDIIRCLKEAVKDQQSNAAAGLELANSRERAVSRLERTLSSKERDIQSLHKEVEKYKSLNTDLKNQQFLIKSHSTELEIKINSMESELAKVTHARKISDELNNGLQKKNIELDNRVHTLSCELESLRKDMLNAEITINEYEVKFAIIGVATEQLSEQVRLNQHLQSDFDDVSRELENMVHQNEIHETEIESLRNELNQSKALEASIRSRLVEVEKSLHQKTLETNNLMNENESLLNDNSSLTSTITNQMQLIEELKSDLKSVENKIVEERSKYESSYESQKRIATILEKHLSAKSEEVCRIRKAKDEEVSKLKSALEAKSSEIQSCTKKIEELEKSFAQVCKENETIQSLRRETEETANDAITMLEEKDSRIEELLKKLETVESSNEKVRQQLVEEQSIVKELRNLREHLTTKNDQNEKNQETLKRVVQTKSAEISALQGQIVQLKAKLSTSHDSIQEYRQTLEEERQKHSELLRELEDSYSDVKARLFGAEKLNLIHDKECARLLDDIESKFNEISQLTSKVETLESINAETLSRNNELQASLATQKEIIEFLENEIALQRAESTSKDDRISSPALQHLKEEISMLKSKLEDKDTELEILDDESKDALAKLSELESKLDASEEEVHLLCEAIEEKEREINELHETIAQLREEKSEALSLLSNLKDGAKNCRQEENVASSDASRQSLSPSAAEIMSKHNELLDNLEKMKYAIHDAISPSKSDVTESFNSTSSSIEMLQKELEEKNSLLETLSEKVQTLMRGVEETEKALHTKETFVNELNITCQQLQTEKAELKIKMKNLMAYIKQLEDVLSHEVKHRREVENSLFSAQKENKILTLENHTKSEELASANKQLKQKEQKVAEQMTVARNLARQLQTTKQKIIALKQHLQQEGLLKDGNLPPAPLNSHAVRNVNHGNSQNQIPDINATMSYDSINWSISEDDNST